MKLITDKLYLEFAEMVECGVSENTLKRASHRNSSCWEFTPAPNDSRKKLVGYEALKPEYKELVNKRYGNPYDYVARTPILDSVRNRDEANTYFMRYIYDGHKHLPIDTVNKYTRADAWLKMIGGLKISDIKKGFGISVPEFYSHCATLIKTEIARGNDDKYTGIYQLPGTFPTSYQRLKNRAADYLNEDFSALISHQFGNKNSSKLGRYEGGFDPDLYDKQMAVIRAIAAKHNNFDAAQVGAFANTIFAANGWETLSRERILQLMHANKAVLTPGRRGRRAYLSDVAMQVKRKAPEFPTYYFTLDGWTAELLYQDRTGYSNRLVVVVVLDAMNKYPVGYAIGDRETPELIRQANRNALLHLHDLFGNWYRPYQLQSDNYALKTLTPFYQAVGHLFTPAAVGNAKSKIIEPYFMYLNKEYCQKMPNWSGFNVTSRKENQVNAEFLNLIKKTFPDRAGVERQIEGIIAAERQKKIAQYVAQWQAMPVDNRHTIAESDWLRVFALPVGKPSRITGKGVLKTIAGETYTYDSFEPEFRKNLHLKWQLFIEPENMSRCLAVSKDGKLQYILEQKMELPMDILSTTDEHNAYRSKVTQFNKDRVKEIIQTMASDNETAQEVVENTPLALDSYNETALKLMFTDRTGQQKEGIQNAKGLGVKKIAAKHDKQDADEVAQQAAAFNAARQNYLKGKLDFSHLND